MTYRNVSVHLEDLADGRAIDPGKFFELDEEQEKDPYNKDKIHRGVFAVVTEPERNPPSDQRKARTSTREGGK